MARVEVARRDTARRCPPPAALSALLLATLHGLIALEASGRMHPEKGLSDVAGGLDLLVRLLAP